MTSSPMMSGPQFTWLQSTGLSGLGEMLDGVLLQTAAEAKNSSQVYGCTLADLNCLAAESCERLPQVTAGMSVSQWWKFWTYNVTIHVTDAKAKCHI